MIVPLVGTPWPSRPAPRRPRPTTAAIPGARLTIVPGMGHDLPPVFWPIVFESVGPAR